MRKNNFSKMMTSAAMLLALSSSMTSCDDILGEWEKPVNVVVSPNEDGTMEVTVTMTATGAEIANATLPSELSAKLATLKDNIAAKGNEEFVVDIKATGLETAGSDNTISVPKVVNSNVALNFENAVSTEKPLVIKAAESESAESSNKVNDLTITMPNISEENAVSLELNMPETTVTLTSSGTETVYDEVKALTAKQTLYVDKGVTIKKLEIDGGTVVVKEGGKVEGIVTDKSVEVTADGVVLEPVEIDGVEKKVLTDENGDVYYAKNLKVIKGEEERVDISFSPGDGFIQMDRLTIAADAAVEISYWYDTESKVKIGEIVGEGEKTARIAVPYFFLYDNVKNASNVIFEGRVHDNSETMNIKNLIAENCVFRNYEDIFYYNAPKVIKGCIFETDIDESGKISVQAPHQTEENLSYEFTFEDCEFGANYHVAADVELYMPDGNTMYSFSNYVITYTFKNCKLGGGEMTKEIGHAFYSLPQSDYRYYYNIDGKMYYPLWNNDESKNMLYPVEE